MTADATPPVDWARIKGDFPILNRQVNDHPMAYLDSAATSQKPTAVLDAMREYYETINANVGRSSHTIAHLASTATESSRTRLARFIGATDANEVVFTKNATESINLLAGSWGAANLGPGDAVVLSLLEHHANIVPWQMLAERQGFEVRWLGLTDNGELDLTDLDRVLDGAKLVSVSAMSNVLGTITPVRRLADAAHAKGALLAIDACQYVPHLPTNVVDLDVDFMAFSGHKMLGPTGVGVLWARRELLEAMPPFLGGGGMIGQVTTDGFTTAEVPHKFEAGTPPIAEIIGLGAAVDYLADIGMEAVREHEVRLTSYFLRTLTERYGDDLVIHGPAEPASRGGVFSFSYKDVHPHDMSQVLDQAGVAVRAGHHCAKPLMTELGVGATARASVYVYNDESDIDQLADALQAADDIFFSPDPPAKTT